MNVIADLQLHSRFSRAVSREMTLSNLATWATRKGIGVIATGDWTHPMWFREIESQLMELGNGLLRLKSDTNQTSPMFLLATEVSCIYKQGNKVRRVHTLIWVPTISAVRKINQAMTKLGCNLLSDGRPIVGLTSIQIAELVLGIEPTALIIPAHAWTPWFSVYGSLGGFDSIDEAFGPYAKNIVAVETGLSSDPSMNWRIEELDSRAILSFSDAHSGPKLGREATVFDVEGELTYEAVYNALSGKEGASIAYTIEFHPEEGKYHYTGHRACGIVQTPQETKEKGATCPVCGKTLTVGVMHRVSVLASRSDEEVGIIKIEPPKNIKATMFGSSRFPKRPGFIRTVPLLEILSQAIGSPVTSPKVQTPYFRLTDELGNEFTLLLETDIAAIESVAGARVAEGIQRVRDERLSIDPGYDGLFGTVKIWSDGNTRGGGQGREQLTLLT
jgi:uncharacterized protein (TIGR00375 family)